MLSSIIKWFGWFSILSGLIVGIVQGNAYEPVIRYDSSFGWSIAITWFFSGLVSGVLFLAISKALDYLEEIAYNTSVLRASNETTRPITQSSYPATGKSASKPSLESLSKMHTFKSND